MGCGEGKTNVAEVSTTARLTDPWRIHGEAHRPWRLVKQARSSWRLPQAFHHAPSARLAGGAAASKRVKQGCEGLQKHHVQTPKKSVCLLRDMSNRRLLHQRRIVDVGSIQCSPRAHSLILCMHTTRWPGPIQICAFVICMR